MATQGNTDYVTIGSLSRYCDIGPGILHARISSNSVRVRHQISLLRVERTGAGRKEVLCVPIIQAYNLITHVGLGRRRSDPEFMAVVNTLRHDLITAFETQMGHHPSAAPIWETAETAIRHREPVAVPAAVDRPGILRSMIAKIIHPLSFSEKLDKAIVLVRKVREIGDVDSMTEESFDQAIIALAEEAA